MQLFYTYILRSEANGIHYVGHTNNLFRRLWEHNQPHKGFTGKHQPWTLIYAEVYRSRSLAMAREKSLKAFGKAYQNIIRRCETAVQLQQISSTTPKG